MGQIREFYEKSKDPRIPLGLEPISISMEDGNDKVFWINGVVDHPVGDKSYLFALLTEVCMDDNQQIIPCGEEILEDGEQLMVMLVKVEEQGEEECLETVDGDSELAGDIMNQLREDGWITFEDDMAAEKQFNEEFAHKVQDDPATKKYEKALEKISKELDNKK
jgi:hypothetical protein